MQQGAHRFERGHTFYNAGVKAAAEMNVKLGWKMDYVQGVYVFMYVEILFRRVS